MIISLIAALTRDLVIGYQNQLPWPMMPADLRYFKQQTLGKPIVMGRKNFDSIGRVLPGRPNIILTRRAGFEVQGATVVNSFEAALAAAGEVPEIMIIGGADIYNMALPIANRLYLTWIEADIEGDTFFPAWEPSEWREVQSERHAADAENAYSYTFCQYERELP
jgi:dihydrofolate reductase